MATKRICFVETLKMVVYVEAIIRSIISVKNQLRIFYL